VMEHYQATASLATSDVNVYMYHSGVVVLFLPAVYDHPSFLYTDDAGDVIC